MFQFGDELKDYWRSLVRIVYPAYCVSCRIPLFLSETYLCTTCGQKVEPLKAPLCLKCANPLPPYGSRLSTCAQCRSERRYFDRGFALVKYQDPVRTILHQVKFQKKLWLLKIFSEPLEQFSCSTQLKNYDVLIPVPLDTRRERERGFNQALMIAQILAGRNREGVPVRQILRKRKRTFPQSQLKRQERLSNLNGAFLVKKRGSVRGKQLLLIDDIFTTGSTINECAKILKEDGAERVDFLTIARS